MSFIPESVTEKWRAEARKMKKFELIFWLFITIIPGIIVAMAENGAIFADELDRRKKEQP